MQLMSLADARIARHTCRARIETYRPTAETLSFSASPGTRAGRGLKLLLIAVPKLAFEASPGTRAGRGLKPQGSEQWRKYGSVHRPAHVPGAD